jgi:hypothetical protein
MWTDPDINDNGFFGNVIAKQNWDINQIEIQFFWPLTEQIPLELDYTDCAKPQLSVISSGTGTTFAFHEPTWTTNIAPQLTVTPIDSVGQLSIGGINVGLETEPKWYQKVLFKLLGFNWKEK